MIVASAAKIFGPYEFKTMYRGTESISELESIVETGKPMISDHAMSFSYHPDVARGFGFYTIRIVSSEA